MILLLLSLEKLNKVMLDTKISKKLKIKWADTAIGSIQCNVNVEPSDKGLIHELDETCKRLFENLKVEDISKQKPIADARKAYKAIGKDPARYRLSSEALLRRIVKEKGIYKINNVVDINNLISISSFYSICAFDVSKIEGSVNFTIGTKEDEYYGIGRGLLNIENLPVFEDQKGKFGSPTSDSERVKVTEKTSQLSMNIISFSGIANLEVHLKRLQDYLVRFAGAHNVEIDIIP